MTPKELIRLREAVGLTRTKAAKLLGISTNYLYSMEVGRRKIPEKRWGDIRKSFQREAQKRIARQQDILRIGESNVTT